LLCYCIDRSAQQIFADSLCAEAGGESLLDGMMFATGRKTVQIVSLFRSSEAFYTVLTIFSAYFEKPMIPILVFTSRLEIVKEFSVRVMMHIAVIIVLQVRVAYVSSFDRCLK